MDRKLVVGLAGMPGAGKSVVVNVARERDYGTVIMGDVVREETRRTGLDLNPKNIGKTMLRLRQKEGPAIVSKRCIPKIDQSIKEKVIVDGIRSLDEVDEFKRHFPKFILVAVHSSPETRFKRLHSRRRKDDPENREIFHKRDMRELSVGLGSAIAMALHMIVNEQELEAVKAEARRTLKRIEEKWMT